MNRGTKCTAASLMLAAVSLAACSGRTERTSLTDSLALGSDRTPVMPDSERTRSVEKRVDCMALPIEDVGLKGRVRKEIRLGPPGYGETPLKDKRDTILVLRLQTPITTCLDTTATSRRSVATVAEVQLTGKVDQSRIWIGREMTVYGTVQRAELAWHYLPVIVRVDSSLRAEAPLGRSA